MRGTDDGWRMRTPRLRRRLDVPNVARRACRSTGGTGNAGAASGERLRSLLLVQPQHLGIDAGDFGERGLDILRDARKRRIQPIDVRALVHEP